MNNDYKWETIGRCKFYTDGTTCTDIEVIDDAKEISFIYPKIMINRERCQKVFSSVEIMLIGRNVISIAIPNKMFPNIKHVESKSNSFINGKYLIERAGGKLLNVFGQSEDAEIDFTLFNRIGSYAFEGCRATKVSDSEDTGFIRINNNAFFGSGFMNQPFVNGIKCVGSLVVDVDETADEVIMPKTGIQYFPDKFVKCMRLPNIRCIDEVTKKPRKVIIEDKNISHDNEVLFRLHEPGIEEFESRIPRYKTIDGILYSADMKTLILCPQGKTGEVIIPDGVVRIRKSAFSNSKIKKVIFPDTMQTIGDEAFYACEKLKEIDFGHGITRIGENGNQHMFSGCAFKKITFPPQIKEIGISAFSLCRELEEVIFNEGLEVIQKEAFQNCQNLLEINLPASIKKVGMDAFVCNARRDKIQDMNINMTTIPEGLALAIIRPGNIHRTRCINVHIDNQDGIFNFVLPCSISATASVYGAYSNIVNVFNQMAYRGHDKKLWNLKCLETAYLHASYPRYVYVVAYKTYRKTKNKYTKEFLADRQKYVAKAIALEMEEKDFIDFVKLDFINLKYDADIVKCLEKQNWNVALAYILEEGKNNNNDAFVI